MAGSARPELDLADRFPLKGVAIKECPVEGT